MALSSDYLKPQWQKKRLEILDRDNFACTQCGETEKTLNVHHSHYVKKRKVWDYPSSSLMTLCNDCHKDTHDNIKQLDPMKVKRLSQLLFDYHDFCCENFNYRKDYDFYQELTARYNSEGDSYLFCIFDEDEIRTDENINNFVIIEALLHYKIRRRNIAKYVNGCIMMEGKMIKPSMVGKDYLNVSRDLQRSVF